MEYSTKSGTNDPGSLCKMPIDIFCRAWYNREYGSFAEVVRPQKSRPVYHFFRGMSIYKLHKKEAPLKLGVASTEGLFTISKKCPCFYLCGFCDEVGRLVATTARIDYIIYVMPQSRHSFRKIPLKRLAFLATF
jgi:hypothetical protein